MTAAVTISSMMNLVVGGGFCWAAIAQWLPMVALLIAVTTVGFPVIALLPLICVSLIPAAAIAGCFCAVRRVIRNNFPGISRTMVAITGDPGVAAVSSPRPRRPGVSPTSPVGIVCAVEEDEEGKGHHDEGDLALSPGVDPRSAERRSSSNTPPTVASPTAAAGGTSVRSPESHFNSRRAAGDSPVDSTKSAGPGSQEGTAAGGLSNLGGGCQKSVVAGVPEDLSAAMARSIFFRMAKFEGYLLWPLIITTMLCPFILLVCTPILLVLLPIAAIMGAFILICGILIVFPLVILLSAIACVFTVGSIAHYYWRQRQQKQQQLQQQQSPPAVAAA